MKVELNLKNISFFKIHPRATLLLLFSSFRQSSNQKSRVQSFVVIDLRRLLYCVHSHSSLPSLWCFCNNSVAQLLTATVPPVCAATLISLISKFSFCLPSLFSSYLNLKFSLNADSLRRRRRLISFSSTSNSLIPPSNNGFKSERFFKM